MKDFLVEYVKKNSLQWKVTPQLIHGDDFQDSLILVFGKPTTAIFAHMDTIGFTVRYDNKLVTIGGPELKTGQILVGHDSRGPIETKLVYDEKSDYIVCDFMREIDRGTELVYKCNFRNEKDFVQSCYLDNRLGLWVCLKLAETLENGIICFSCWEEHGGGSVSLLTKFIYEQYKVRQALVCDITWVTEGVRPGRGVVISMRDRSIPRRSYLNKIISLAEQSGIPFQLEIEGTGGSDGKEIQASPYPIDWCFIGAAEMNVHTPEEKVMKTDIDSMLNLYQYLMKKL